MRRDYTSDEVPVLDTRAIEQLRHGSTIRSIAQKWYYRNRSRMRTATFEPGPTYQPKEYSRYGCETWRDLEAELWIAKLQHPKLTDPSTPYLIYILENKIRDAMNAGRNRYRIFPEHTYSPDTNYGADGGDLNTIHSIEDFATTENTAFVDGYLRDHEPSLASKKRTERRWAAKEREKSLMKSA
jgi:predicted ATPase